MSFVTRHNNCQRKCFKPQKSRLRGFQPFGDFQPEHLVMPNIPGENLIGSGFQRAACDQRIIDGAADDVPTGGVLEDGDILRAFKADALEPRDNIFNTGHRLGGCGFVGLGEPCECRIDLGEAMRGAPVGLPGAVFVEPDTGLMMRMVGNKHGDENGGIEKPRQLESSETAQVAL